VITPAQAEAVLTTSVTRTQRASNRDRTLLRSAVSVFSLLLGCGVLAGGAIQASSGRFTQSDDASQENATFSWSRAGYIRVVAEPWADVLIDGELAVTTPTALRLPLTPGTHYLKFVNPFYHEQIERVHVRSGETETVRVVLKPKHANVSAQGASGP
jgi:serine/threonine-protein kinase